MKTFAFILSILFSFLGVGQPRNELQQANHTFRINKDSLTIFQEAEFYSIVDWYAESDTLKFSGTTIFFNIYYKPDLLAIGNMPYTNFSLDTFPIDGLSMGSHTLIVNSYSWGDSVDFYLNYYEFYTLSDSDTSYFQVLSDNSISFRETPISIYPNPAKDKLTIEGLKPEDGPIAVSLSDLKGKVILETTASHSQPEIDVSSLPKGTYLLTSPGLTKRIIVN